MSSKKVYRRRASCDAAASLASMSETNPGDFRSFLAMATLITSASASEGASAAGAGAIENLSQSQLNQHLDKLFDSDLKSVLKKLNAWQINEYLDYLVVTGVTDQMTEEELSRRFKLYLYITRRNHKKRYNRGYPKVTTRQKRRKFHQLIIDCSARNKNLSTFRSQMSRTRKGGP